MNVLYYDHNTTSVVDVRKIINALSNAGIDAIILPKDANFLPCDEQTENIVGHRLTNNESMDMVQREIDRALSYDKDNFDKIINQQIIFRGGDMNGE